MWSASFLSVLLVLVLSFWSASMTLCPHGKTVLAATFEYLWKPFSSLDFSRMARGHQHPLKEGTLVSVPFSLLTVFPLTGKGHLIRTLGAIDGIAQ